MEAIDSHNVSVHVLDVCHADKKHYGRLLVNGVLCSEERKITPTPFPTALLKGEH